METTRILGVMGVNGMRHADVPADVNALASTLLGCAIELHRGLGPGLREQDYADCLAIDLEERGLAVEREKPLSLVYKGRALPRAARLDMVIEGRLPVELKAVDALHPHHFLQARSYVRFGGFPLGILVNFHAARLVDGWHRILPGKVFPPVASPAVPAPSHEGSTREEETI